MSFFDHYLRKDNVVRSCWNELQSACPSITALLRKKCPLPQGWLDIGMSSYLKITYSTLSFPDEFLRLKPEQQVLHPGMTGANEAGAMVAVLIEMQFMRHTVPVEG